MEKTKYSAEFKAKAVERYLGGGISMLKLSAETGACRATLSEWVRRAREAEAERSDFIDLTPDAVAEAPEESFIKVELGGATMSVPASMLDQLIRGLRR